jgi:hypothetical protein
MSVKKFAANVFAGTVAAVSILSTAAAAPSIAINGSAPIAIKTPPGFSYSANTGGTAGTLAATTEGYVLCANIYVDNPPAPSAVTFVPQHTRWTLPTATDIRTVGYVDGVLAVNSGAANFVPDVTLACQSRGPVGEIVTPFSGYGDMLFRSGLDSFEETQFGNLVNWVPVRDFSWTSPDWTKVPNDSCTWDMTTNYPTSSDDSLCAAASGVRPIAVNSQNDARYGDRSPTMLTKTTSTKFIYLARLDARFGAQQGAPNSHFPGTAPQQTQASSVSLRVRDGFDSNYLSAAGTYCLLKALPNGGVLTDTVCSDSAVYYTGTVNGNLSEPIGLDNAFAQAKSLFIAVVRTKTTDLPQISTPVAAIAVLADPGVTFHEAGDEFIGDDLVFGFPEGQGFPWMGGQ